MNKLPDTKEIIDSIADKLVPSGWELVLRMFLYSSDMEQIIDGLKRLREGGKRFIPSIGIMFRFLEECPFNNIKAVLLVDCNRFRQDTQDSIAIWSKQGVLVISISPTFIADKNRVSVGSKDMAKEWMPFIVYLIDKVNEYYPNIPWIVADSKRVYRDLIKSKNTFTVLLSKEAYISKNIYNNIRDMVYWNGINGIIRAQGKKR